MNNTTIRSEKVTIDMHICSTLAAITPSRCWNWAADAI